MIYFASTNKNKAQSVIKSLSLLNIDVAYFPLDVIEPQLESLEEIANFKARYAYNIIKKPCICIDSGFYIASLNGFPGVYAKYATDTIGVEGFLRLLKGKPRECKFINSLSYLDSEMKQPIIFQSSVEGILANSKRKEITASWGVLHSVFIPKGCKKTTNQMTETEKESLRRRLNRNNYYVKFAKWYKKERCC